MRVRNTLVWIYTVRKALELWVCSVINVLSSNHPADVARLMDTSQIPDRQQELLAEFEKRKKVQFPRGVKYT